MKTFLKVSIIATCSIFSLAGCMSAPNSNSALVHADGPTATQKNQASAPKKTMRAFRSEAELASYFREIAEKQRRETRGSFGVPESQPAPTASAALKSADSAGPASDKAASESVTNVQHAGVDEGGIVKVHGNHLVVLRRGRLFTVAIGDGALTPISSVDAFAPDINPAGTWYDEMLVSDDTVAVIGYSYQRGGTYVYPGASDPFASFPAVRRWHKGATADEFHRIITPNHVYRTEQPLDSSYGVALHTVTVCDLAHGDFDCTATSVVGPPGRVFYVSPESVYIWVNAWVRQGDKMREQSMVYRMPLNGAFGPDAAPSALKVSGSPVDQFSFLESEDNHLNVLVRSDTSGDGMWGAEVAQGDVALMRIPLASFSDGSEAVPSSSYRELPKPAGYTFQNRFVGDYLLYGTGSGWGYAQKTDRGSLYAVRWAGGSDVHELSISHGVDRIEQLGSDAVVVGTDGKNLHFTSVRLGKWPAVADDYMRPGASQGELRSQGFFYKPDARGTGMLGLPISEPARPGYRHLFETSAAILFLKNDSLHFQELGELAAQPERAKDDGCRASCVDWYGNARPLFVRGRVIALLGYELVEGRMEYGRIHETRRVNYAPQSLAALNR